jgi:ribosome-associated protein
MKKEIENLKNEIVEKLDDLKAEDIISIDVSKTSSLADYIVIATGRSTKHLDATADNLRRFLKQKGIVEGIIPEGVAQGGWVVLDLGDVIVHLFTQEIREVYNLEKLWNFKK